MANYQQAPTLKFNGGKTLGNNFYGIPQDLADIIFRELGNSSAQLRIMIVLIGTKEGFNISDKWICERTGLQHPSYITARKALVKRGWLTHEAAKGITVNIDAIYGRNCGNTTLPEEKNCSNTTLPERSNMVLPQRGNMVLPEGSNMVLPITNKETDNKIDKLTEAQEQAPSLEEPEAEKGTIENPLIVSKDWLIEHYNELYECANKVWRYNSKFYKMEG